MDHTTAYQSSSILIHQPQKPHKTLGRNCELIELRRQTSRHYREIHSNRTIVLFSQRRHGEYKAGIAGPGSARTDGKHAANWRRKGAKGVVKGPRAGWHNESSNKKDKLPLSQLSAAACWKDTSENCSARREWGNEKNGLPRRASGALISIGRKTVLWR